MSTSNPGIQPRVTRSMSDIEAAIARQAIERNPHSDYSAAVQYFFLPDHTRRFCTRETPRSRDWYFHPGHRRPRILIESPAHLEQLLSGLD